MDNAMKVVFGVLVTLAAIGGLILASRGDLGIQIFGLLLFAFGVFLDFWFIKLYFDAQERAAAESDAR